MGSDWLGEFLTAIVRTAAAWMMWGADWRSPELTERDLGGIFERAGDYCEGFNFGIHWPRPLLS